ncbi:MAG TPA: GTP pyrophosphokinase [Clostridiales bacterium]|nr:GTP pyrophosphokinase [Clostridiales bacterium]
MDSRWLEKAIEIAVKAHRGQKDKAGEVYILHPLRVMMSQASEEGKVVAVLHDVIEDSNLTIYDLDAEGFSERIIDAVYSLTKQDNENYFNYVRRCKENDIAKYVKLADLEDNSDLRRIKNPTEKDFERNKRYKKAMDILLGFCE